MRTSAFTAIVALVATGGVACVFIDEVNVGDPTLPSPDSGHPPQDSDDSGEPEQPETTALPDDGAHPTTTLDSKDDGCGCDATDGEDSAGTTTGDSGCDPHGETSDTESAPTSTGEPESTGSSSTGEPAGSSSTGEPPLDDLCGNGVIDIDEVCDDGVNDGAHGGCRAGCVERAPFCGDGELNDPSEACDDGNTADDDACNHLCQPASCGDGVVQAGEECDSETISSCESLGFWSGMLACDLQTCTYDVSLCVGCGNGLIEGDEACDGADLGGASCEALGFLGGALACNGKCSALDTSGCLLALP